MLVCYYRVVGYFLKNLTLFFGICETSGGLTVNIDIPDTFCCEFVHNISIMASNEAHEVDAVTVALEESRILGLRLEDDQQMSELINNFFGREDECPSDPDSDDEDEWSDMDISDSDSDGEEQHASNNGNKLTSEDEAELNQNDDAPVVVENLADQLVYR